jgi:hypothetical protein
MWPFKAPATVDKELRKVFLDESAYAEKIEALAIESSSRMARGGVALQMGDVVTEAQFNRQMVSLKERVEGVNKP